MTEKLPTPVCVAAAEFHEMVASTGIGLAAQAQQVGLGALVAERLIEEVVGATDAVINNVGTLLPNDFPMDVAESVFEGIRRHSVRLAAEK